MSSPRPEEKDKDKEKEKEPKLSIQDQVKNTITTLYQNRDLYKNTDTLPPFRDMPFDTSPFGKKYDEIKDSFVKKGVENHPVVERVCANLKEAMDFAYTAVLSGQTWQNSYAERALTKAIKDANENLSKVEGKDKDGKDIKDSKIEDKVIADKQFQDLKKIIEDKKNLEYKNALDALSQEKYNLAAFIDANADAQSNTKPLEAATATGEVKLPPNMSYKKKYDNKKSSLYSIHTDDKGGVYFTVPAPATLKSVAAAWEETLEFMRTQARATSIEIDLPNCKEGNGYNAARMDVDFFKKTLQAAFDKGFHVTLSSGVLKMLREKGTTVEREIIRFVAERNAPIDKKIEEAKKTANTELVKAAEAAAISHEKRITDSIKSYADDLKSINVSRKPIEIISSTKERLFDSASSDMKAPDGKEIKHVTKPDLFDDKVSPEVKTPDRKDEKKAVTTDEKKSDKKDEKEVKVESTWKLDPDHVKSAFERINKLESLFDKVKGQVVKLENDSSSAVDAKDADQQKRLQTRATELATLREDVAKEIQNEKNVIFEPMKYKESKAMSASLSGETKDPSVDRDYKGITNDLDNLLNKVNGLVTDINNAKEKLATAVPPGPAPTPGK